MVYLFHGRDPYANWESLLAILKKEHTEPRILYGSELNAFTDIADGAENFSFFGKEENKAIVIKRLSQTKSKTLIKEIGDKLAAGYKWNIYIWEDTKLEKFSALVNLASKYGRVTETKTPTIQSMSKFVLEKLAEHNLKIADDVLLVLLNKATHDKFSMIQELEKLSLLKRSQKKSQITLEDVKSITTDLIEDEVWDLTDAISKRNKPLAMDIMNRMLKTYEDFPFIIAVLTNQLELLYMLKKNVPYDVLVNKFGIKSYVIEINRSNAFKFSDEEIKMLFNKTANLDFSVKQGKIDARLGLNLLITTL